MTKAELTKELRDYVNTYTRPISHITIGVKDFRELYKECGVTGKNELQGVPFPVGVSYDMPRGLLISSTVECVVWEESQPYGKGQHRKVKLVKVNDD